MKYEITDIYEKQYLYFIYLMKEMKNITILKLFN